MQGNSYDSVDSRDEQFARRVNIGNVSAIIKPNNKLNNRTRTPRSLQSYPRRRKDDAIRKLAVNAVPTTLIWGVGGLNPFFLDSF